MLRRTNKKVFESFKNHLAKGDQLAGGENYVVDSTAIQRLSFPELCRGFLVLKLSSFETFTKHSNEVRVAEYQYLL